MHRAVSGFRLPRNVVLSPAATERLVRQHPFVGEPANNWRELPETTLLRAVQKPYRPVQSVFSTIGPAGVRYTDPNADISIVSSGVCTRWSTRCDNDHRGADRNIFALTCLGTSKI